MRPPMCEVCDESTEDAGSFGLLTFADHEPLPDGMVGHPRGLGWFCARHAPDAAQLLDSTLAEVVAVLRQRDDDARTSTAAVPALPTTPIDRDQVRGRDADMEWRDGDGVSGVARELAGLRWWSRPGGPNGRFGEGAMVQSLSDYRAAGPAVTCPAEVERRLDAMVGRGG